MEANPWAVVVVVVLLFILESLGVSVFRTGLFVLLFFGYVPLWIMGGYFWDKVRIRGDGPQ
jgi:hypothetical protein